MKGDPGDAAMGKVWCSGVNTAAAMEDRWGTHKRCSTAVAWIDIPTFPGMDSIDSVLEQRETLKNHLFSMI